MKITIHKAEDRGIADFGWLKARQSFSFGNWFDPTRINFGALRVLNDDVIAPGAGFPTHPHSNMEIVTIPLSGSLEHLDSMGNKAQIKHGEVQVMSAGYGITHSEYNASQTEELRLFQLWLFSNKQNATPRYDEVKLNLDDRKNKLQQVVSPYPNDDGAWIYQDAWIYLGDYDKEQSFTLSLKKKTNGFYILVINGSIEINKLLLHSRDAIGLESFDDEIKVNCLERSEILVLEVPMEI